MTPTTHTEPLWLAHARGLVGLKEIVGSAHEPEIVRFFADAGHPWVKDDETAWCAAFANAMLKRAGVKGTGSLAARSFLSWGEDLRDAPRVGCLAVFRRGTEAWQGHVAFFLGAEGEYVRVLGGNQGNAVSIARYRKSDLLGYRWPAEGAPSALSAVEAKAVQARLKALGYHEVGLIDGKVGSRTTAAIAAFQHDRGLAVTGRLDEETRSALDDGAPRPIAPERANGEPENSRIVAASENAGAIGAGTVTIGAGTVLAQTAEKVETASGIVANVKLAFAPFASLLADYWPLILVAVGGVVLWQAAKARRARIEDHRSGKTT
jgi:uncharacterized protein (TIGR02594 family)